MPRFEKHSKVAPGGYSPTLPAATAANMQLFFEMEGLKSLLRTGWVNHGMSRDKVESVADHTWGVAFLADSLAAQYAPGLDRNKMLRMALIHDFGEVGIGDKTPHDNISRAERRVF